MCWFRYGLCNKLQLHSTGLSEGNIYMFLLCKILAGLNPGNRHDVGCLLYYSTTTLSQDDINSILQSFANAKYSWVFFGVVLGGLSHVSRSYRWKYLLKPLGYNISFLNSVLAVFSGYLINYTILNFISIFCSKSLSLYVNCAFL